MTKRRLDPTAFGYSPRISMLRRFTNTIAGTGVVFAAMHVFFRYMSFDKTPNEATGEVPRFLDLAEARYYLVLLLFFLLTACVSGFLHAIPALSLLPSAATTTYILLLYDADVLTAGPMTFLIFSLFLIAGYSYIALYAGGKWSGLLFRSAWALVGSAASVWAFKVYLAAPYAAERLSECLVPSAELDGLSAVWRYERLETLKATLEAGNRWSYLAVALCGLLLSALLVVLPRLKPVIFMLSIALVGFLSYLVTFEKLSYYPMLFSAPLILLSVGALVHSTTEERAVDAPPSGETTQSEAEPPSGETTRNGDVPQDSSGEAS